MRARRIQAPRFETMEDRVLMDGNVTATLSGGALSFLGDDASNSVVVADLGHARYLVSGMERTTINGARGIIFGGVTGGMSFVMGEGHDTLAFGNRSGEAMTIHGNLHLAMGDGHNRVLFGMYERRGGMQWFSGAVHVEGDITVASILRPTSYTDVIAAGLRCDGDMSADLGYGDAEHELTFMPIGPASMEPWMAPGPDAVGCEVAGELFVHTNATGPVQVTLDGAEIGGRLRVFTDDGDDRIELTETTVGGMVWLETYEGRDEVLVEDHHADLRRCWFQDDLIIRTGGGWRVSDTVHISNTSVDGATAIDMQGITAYPEHEIEYGTKGTTFSHGLTITAGGAVHATLGGAGAGVVYYAYVLGDLTIDLDEYNRHDTIEIRHAIITGETDIDTYDGCDEVILTDTLFADRFHVDLGDNPAPTPGRLMILPPDTLTVTDCLFLAFAGFAGGNGRDEITLTRNEFRATAAFDGGLGNDTLTYRLLGNDFLAPVFAMVYTGFETVA